MSESDNHSNVIVGNFGGRLSDVDLPLIRGGYIPDFSLFESDNVHMCQSAGTITADYTNGALFKGGKKLDLTVPENRALFDKMYAEYKADALERNISRLRSGALSMRVNSVMGVSDYANATLWRGDIQLDLTQPENRHVLDLMIESSKERERLRNLENYKLTGVIGMNEFRKDRLRVEMLEALNSLFGPLPD